MIVGHRSGRVSSHAGYSRSSYPDALAMMTAWVAVRNSAGNVSCWCPCSLPTCRRYGMGVIPWSPLAGGWLTGRYRKGQDLPETHRAQRIPQRYDMSLPGNQAKLEAADALAQLTEDAGLSLIDMALAFVLNHPAVTAAIIGPRTMDHLESQLSAADIRLTHDLLDRVAPGTTINVADNGWTQPSLQPALRRR